MYCHKIVDSLGKRREKKKSSFKTEKEALRSLLEVKASILSGQTRHIEHSQMTGSNWLDIWYETKKRGWKVATKRINKNVISHLKRLIGEYKWNSLPDTNYERDSRDK